MNKIKLVVVILICILLLPFIVNAKECNQNSIKIKSIKMKEKSEYTEELNKTTFENNIINLDLKMNKVGDFIQYELEVKNTSDKVYNLDKFLTNEKSDYFDFLIINSDKKNSIEPNKETKITLKISYKKEVPNELLDSDLYSEQIKLSTDLLNKNETDINSLINPKTKSTVQIIISGLRKRCRSISYPLPDRG